MEYKVIKSFIDKDTGKGYNENNTFTSDDAERVSFLAENGFIHAPAIEKTEVTQDDSVGGMVDNDHSGTEDDLDSFEQLKQEASALKIKGYTKMTEEELRTAIDVENAKKASE